MNNKFVFVLAAVCLLLSLIIMGEWFYASQSQKQTLSAIEATEATSSDDVMPEIELIQESEESFEDLVARPLFIKGRKPVNEPLPEENQTTAAVVVNNFDWQLNGVYSTKAGLSALFSRITTRVPKDNYRKIKTGVDLDGWKLAEIHGDKVILKQGGQQKELPLRKPKSKELPKGPPIPKGPNSPQPIIPPPAEGEIESNNENL
ncbi:MAG: hypothetical protein NTV43_05115 [Methylococcales bacterium]|nr:hypothetical protein [Methylococcales bacterium]